MQNFISMIFLGAVITLLLSACGGNKSKPSSPDNGSNNTENRAVNYSGNIIANGFVAEAGGYIYYTNFNDSRYMYKKKSDGSGSAEKMTDAHSFSINVSGGEIYYLKSTDGVNSYIYNIKTGKTDDVKLNDRDTKWLTYYEGWLYYAELDSIAGGVKRYDLYKMRTDKTGKDRLDTFIERPNISNDGFIYYISSEPGELGIYKIHTGKTGKTRISTDIAKNINVVGDAVYYVDSYTNDLCRINKNGTGKTVLDSGYDIIDIIAGEDWIYYTGIDRGDLIQVKYLCRVSANYTIKERLFNFNCDILAVIGDTLYYRPDGVHIYKMKTDGSGNELVD